MKLLLPSHATASLPIRALRLVRSTQLCLNKARHHSTSSSVPAAAPYDILFCGTDTFAAASVSALISSPALLASLHVLTPPDVSQRWGAARMKVSPVKQLALSHSIPHTEVPSAGMDHYVLPSTLQLGEKALLLTCSFGHLIPDTLLDQFPNPWQRLNIHPSLLPQLRGAAPIQWALARRLAESGVSIQTLEKGKFDTGRIVAQTAFDFPPPMEGGTGTFLEVEKVMARRAADLLVTMLSDLPNHWNGSWQQNEQDKTYAPKLKAQHSVIRWNKMDAGDIVAREKGFAYLYPLSTTLHPPSSGTSSFRPVAVTFSDTSALASDKLAEEDPATAASLLQKISAPGLALYSPPLDALIIRTRSDGERLMVKTVKVAGKKAKPAADFFKAYRDRADPASGLLTFQ